MVYVVLCHLQEITDMGKLTSVVQDYLTECNAASKKPLNLVLFQFALEHTARWARHQGDHRLLISVFWHPCVLASGYSPTHASCYWILATQSHTVIFKFSALPLHPPQQAGTSAGSAGWARAAGGGGRQRAAVANAASGLYGGWSGRGRASV